MYCEFAPDTTNEGWNTWPTEKVSHALVRDRPCKGRIEAQGRAMLELLPADVVALRLAPVIREAIEDAVSLGKAEALRDSLVAFALSRVDWLQLAQAQLEAAAGGEAAPLPLGATG